MAVEKVVEMRVNKQSIVEVLVLLGFTAAFAGSFVYAFKAGIVVCFIAMVMNSILWFYRCQALYNKFNLVKAPKVKDEKEETMKELLFALKDLKNIQNIQTAISEVKIETKQENAVPVAAEPEKIEIKEEKEFI